MVETVAVAVVKVAAAMAAEAAAMVAEAAAMAVATPPILHGRLLLCGHHPGVEIGVHHGLAPLDPVS
jgi:hypothetical protein